MTARLAQITRHPIKAHGREDLASVLLSAGACLPWDRHWAVAHEAARIEPGWNGCQNFTRGAKAPALMAVTARLDETAGRITLDHPDRGPIDFQPDVAADLPRFLDWVDPLIPADRARPVRLVTAGRGMTDSDFPSVSILSNSSLAALARHMGRTTLSPHRFRGNLWVAGWAPWAEFSMIGKTLQIGTARLRIKEPITRCRATTADPETGRIDADTLGALESLLGRQDFGVYAEVTQGGTIALEDEVTVL